MSTSEETDTKKVVVEEKAKENDNDDDNKENIPPPPAVPPPPAPKSFKFDIKCQPMMYTHGGAPVWALNDMPGYGLVPLYPTPENAIYFRPALPY